MNDRKLAVYANCGRWNGGATDFVIVHQDEIVLASWGNFCGEFHLRNSLSIDPSGESQSSSSIELLRAKTVKQSITQNKLQEFFSRSGYPIQVWHPSDHSSHTPNSPLDFTGDDIYVFVSDCHITYLQGWVFDGFSRPVQAVSKPKGGCFMDRHSLSSDFVRFLKHCSDHAAKVIHVGDLYDYWHVQWMYEKAFDILEYYLRHTSNRTTNDSATTLSLEKARSVPRNIRNKSRIRFPIELLSKPWQQEGHPLPVFQWWNHFAAYLNTENTIDAIRYQWTDVSPIDVMTILLWELEYDIEHYATPLSEEYWRTLVRTLNNYRAPSCRETNPHASLFIEKAEESLFAKAVELFHDSLGGKSAPAIDFLTNASIEKRIRDRYPELEDWLDSFQTGSNYVRGNHDCVAENSYLKVKFQCQSEFGKTQSGQVFCDSKSGELEDEGVALDTPDTLIVSNGRICVEHGDAWDVQNNDHGYDKLNVVRFRSPLVTKMKRTRRQFWSKDRLMEIAKMAFPNGGYHAAKGYTTEQLTSPGKMVRCWIHRWKQKIGDIFLEAPAEVRAEYILGVTNTNGTAIRLVIMGHTHLPKIISFDLLSN